MATKILLKYGQGLPLDGDISGPGELAIDIQNKVIYTKDAGDNIVMLGADVSASLIDWSQLQNVPTEFPPADHTHNYTEVNNGSGKTLDVEIAAILQHLQDLDTELGALQGQLTFGGTFSAATNAITSTTKPAEDLGFTAGAIPSPPPLSSEGIYFICEKAGDFESQPYNSGDWLVSEGNVNGWTGIHFDATVSIMWDEVGGKPTEFPPEAHTHVITDVTDLQAALDDKADLTHQHVIGDVTGLQAALDAKADMSVINGGSY
jgi:hypothetical protein